MNKLLKWLIGLLAAVGGIVALFIPKSNKKIKKIKGNIKDNEINTKKVKDILKEKEKEGKIIKDKIDDSLDKVEDLENQKNKGAETDNVSGKDAANWLKDYVKK